MIRIPLKRLAAVLVLFAVPVAAQEFRLKEEASVIEKPLPDGGWSRTVVHPRFDFVSVWHQGQETPTSILIAQRLESTMRSDSEGAQSTLQATAWTRGKKPYDKKLWSITAEADLGEIVEYDEYFRATRYGCCAAESTHTLYNVETGKTVATYTAEGVGFIEVPNTPVRRLITYHSAAASISDPAVVDALGVLTLSSKDGGVLHRVVIRSSNKQLEGFTPTLTLKVDGEKEESQRIDLWAAEKNPVPAAIRGFQVRLVFEDGQTVRIPVTGDDFDLDKATVPQGFRLARLPKK